jgi:hypothetical protein
MFELHAGGLDVVRKKAKEAFRQNAQLTDEAEIKKAVARGRYAATSCAEHQTHTNKHTSARHAWAKDTISASQSIAVSQNWW